MAATPHDRPPDRPPDRPENRPHVPPDGIDGNERNDDARGRSQAAPQDPPHGPPRDEVRRAFARLVLLGAASTGLQTLLAREFLADFTGNEAVLAALLTPWLIAGALGALLGRSGAKRPWHVAAALFALGPVAAATLLGARVLPRVFVAGAAPGVGWALVWAAVLATPACLLAGLVFSWLARDRADAAGRAYLGESLGAGLAGALLGLVLLGRAPAFAILGGVVLACAVAAALGSTRRLAIACAASGGALAAALLVLPVGTWALGLQAEHLRGATERQSAHSSIVIARSGEETTVFADRLPVVSGVDPGAAEEAAHLPLAYHPAPGAVAIIGVAPAGTVDEVLRHGVRTIDYLVEDQVLLDTLRAHLPELERDHVRARDGDARRFLAEHAAEQAAAPARTPPHSTARATAPDRAFDAILLFAHEPTSVQRNRLFTEEFFRTARAALSPGGLFAVSLPGHAAYASPATRRLHSSIARTLGAAFGDVLVLPGSRTVYLGARDRTLPKDAPPRLIGETLAARRITPRYLEPSVLSDLLSPQRVADSRAWSSLREAINRDLHPTTYRLALDRALAEFGDQGPGVLLLFAGMLLVGALVAVRPRAQPVEFAVLTSGMSGLGIELVLMLAFQIATGALYREMALLLSGFMMGAALGSRFGRDRSAEAWVLGADAAQIGLMAVLAVGLPALVAAGPWARFPSFALVVLAGFLPGAQFSAAARVLRGPRPEAVAGSLWSADLLGAALSAALVVMVLMPTLGLRGTVAALAGAKVLSTVALLLPKREATARTRSRLALLLPVLFVGFVFLAAADPTYGTLYEFTFLRPYPIAALVAVLLALLAAFEPARLRVWMTDLGRRLIRLRRSLAARGEQLLHFAVLLPVAAFPAARCYFAIPYIFCHVCPRQCVFGVLRRYMVPAALIANLRDHRFCERVCPLGTVQTACEALPRSRPRRVAWLGILRLAVLAFVAISYFVLRRDHQAGKTEGGSAYDFFFNTTYAPTFAVLAAAAGLLVLSLRVRRPFCEGLCPIGAASDLVTRAEKRLRRGRRHLDVLPSDAEHGS